MDVQAVRTPPRLPLAALLTRLRDPSTRAGAIAGMLVCLGAGFIFSAAHVAGGAHPLGIALLCALSGDYATLCLLGGFGAPVLTGADGVLLAASALVAYLLRLIFSLPGRRRFLPECEALLCERGQLRVTAAAVGGVFNGFFSLLLAGGGVEWRLYFLFMTLLCPLLCACFLPLLQDRHTLPLLWGGTPAAFGGIRIAGRKRRGGRGSLTVEAAETSDAAEAAETDMRDKADAEEGADTADTAGEELTAAVQFSAVVLLLCGVLALSAYTVFGVSVGLCLALCGAFFTAARFGALRACAVGLIVTLGVNAALAPAVGLAGLCAGLLWGLGISCALTAGGAAACLCAAYSGGVVTLLSILPEVVVTALLVFPFGGKLLSEPLKRQKEQLRQRNERAVRALTEKENTLTPADKTRALAETFSELSLQFRDMGKMGTSPDSVEYLTALDGVCNRYCSTCPHRGRCWESEDKPAYRAIRRLADKLARDGVLSADGMSEELVCDCRHIGRIYEDIRVESASLYERRRRGNHSEFLAAEYAFLSELLRDASEEQAKNAVHDRKLERRLSELPEVRRAGLSVSVCGKRFRRMAVGGGDADSLCRSIDGIRTRFEEISGCVLSKPVFAREGDVPMFSFCTETAFVAERAVAASSSVGGEISGDVSLFFDGKDGKSYALLCDGMGSGNDARETARLCVTFLRRLIAAGMAPTEVLKMLNNLIRCRGVECSATVDLLSVDLLSGKSTFLKCGAAVSYISRGDSLFRVRSGTAPLGLLRNLDIEKTGFEPEDGDVILMFSDGVCPDPEHEPAFMTLANDCRTEDLQAYANQLLAAIRRRSRSDDATLLLTRIKRKSTAQSAFTA